LVVDQESLTPTQTLSEVNQQGHKAKLK